MRPFIIFMLFCLPVLVTAQSWEGKITYENSYAGKTEHMTSEQITAMMGNLAEYYIKDANYKSVTNGKMMEWQLYIAADNKLYTKTTMSPNILWIDGAINDDSLISVSVNKAATTILGYSCDELVLTLKSGVQKYYYSSKLPVDPNLFKKHLYGNWHDYLVRAKAVPLKMIIDNPDYTMQSVATKVEAQKIDAALFVLPEGVPVVKSPY